MFKGLKRWVIKMLRKELCKNNDGEFCKIREEEFLAIKKDFDDISIYNISVLVRHNENEYVVFLDCVSELDWETTDEYENNNIATKTERTKMLTDIEWLQHHPTLEYISESKRKSFVMLLAECWCYALDGCFEAAEKHLARTEKYINDRKIETSRKWQLLFCYFIALTIVIINVIISQNFTQTSKSIVLVDWSKYIMFGAFGTTLSVIIKSGTLTYNCESGKWLNFLEIFSKMIASAISCVIIITLFNLDMIFTSLKGSHSSEILRFLCLIAGFSERLVPSILQKFESTEITKEEK